MGKVCDIDIQSCIVQIRAHTHPVSGISVPLWSKMVNLYLAYSQRPKWSSLSGFQPPARPSGPWTRSSRRSQPKHTSFFRRRNASGTRRATLLRLCLRLHKRLRIGSPREHPRNGYSQAQNFEEKIGANWENITIISILHIFWRWNILMPDCLSCIFALMGVKGK